jgi:hypothetical protein
MKKLICISVMLFTAIASYSQSNLNPPIGLTWGSTVESTKQVLNKLGTFGEISDASYGKFLRYDKVAIGTTSADVVFLKFTNNKLFEIKIAYYVEDADIQSKYDQICQIITSKYGKGNEYRTFKYPYEDKASDFEMAVKGGYADISTFWIDMFTDGAITVEINKIPGIILGYQNSDLFKEARKASDSKDNVSF